MTKRIRTKLGFLILVSAVLCLLLFWILWKQQSNVWKYLSQFPSISGDKDGFVRELEQRAENYVVPDSESDEAAQESIEPFFEDLDKYTGVYVYEIGGKGLYRCGKSPKIVEKLVYGTLLDIGYRLTGEEIELRTQYPMEFQNGEFMVMIYSYHALLLTIPYLALIVSICIGGFFGINTFFINRRVNDILTVKEIILEMSSGNLDYPVPDCGRDEIGILAEELDHLRIVLKEQIQRENDSRRANQDLIAAISHDLRTPLTILNGYLEVLKLDKVPEKRESEYLERCTQKVNDIKELTDKMFEYAIVYEEIEDINMTLIPSEELCGILKGNIEYLSLAGFHTQTEIQECSGLVNGDLMMIKRIFNNLFSNILKYGDKNEIVNVLVKEQRGHVNIILCNKIKTENGREESSRIGLKSVEKMVQMHGGTVHVSETDEAYQVEVIL